ncbi:FMN-dependent NADH-azoreductase [Mucilaginibacter sp. HD30]
MKKILHIISSPRGEASFSIKLGNAIVEKIKKAHPGSAVTEVNLDQQNFPHLEEAHITSFFTPVESRSVALQEAVKHSDEAINAIQEADIIVIGAPMYNYSIPSSLKAWLDHIIRAGVTFRYDANGLHGLLENKKVYIAESTGGIYSEGPMQGNDFVAPYLKTVLGHIGLTDLTVFRVEGTSLPNVKDIALEKGIASIHLN